MKRESVWDFPRPPKLEPSPRTVKVMFARELIAESSRAFRVLETSHPPTWYIPREDVRVELLPGSHKASTCEWKGKASYWTVRVGDAVAENSAWSYEHPTTRFEPIRGFLAFYPARFECYVDEERVTPQPGGLYGGWITDDVTGPFKGGPGSWGW